MAQPAISAITMALLSSPPVDNAGQLDVKDTANFLIGAKHARGLPPTPPNSLSPNLPAHLLPPIQVDQDMDLDDAVDHAAAQDQPELTSVRLSKGALSGLENAQAITPSMLARDHLPGIILGHGPIAIRHVMGCLTQSVPGFSRIPPAKARRLVVAALEGRSAGGPQGDIEFEKVGWGRWDAHVKGQKHSRLGSSYSEGKMSPSISEPSSYAVSHAGSGFPISKIRQRPNHAAELHMHSWTGSSMPSFDEGLEHMSMSEDEADNMSLDDSDSDESVSDDDTEPEDWAAIGADGLRKASIPTAASGSVRRNYNLLCIPGPVSNSRRFSSSTRRPSTLGTSLPIQGRRASQQTLNRITSPSSGHGLFRKDNPFNDSNGTQMDVDQTPQEMDAVAALMRMGSM